MNQNRQTIQTEKANYDHFEKEPGLTKSGTEKPRRGKKDKGLAKLVNEFTNKRKNSGKNGFSIF
jgi:hypothetical protein